ncbi:MAG TPA: carboxypeptidase-like regulatory domain-containing protein [Rhodothermales bacterium]|nr:carboxypeptidase-like regulatory domain-containing protein [Rhodothermales bacterium]
MTSRYPRLLTPLVFLLLFPQLVSAQAVPTATLVGHITNAETGEPLQGAHVFIAVSMNGTVADAGGAYRLDAVPVGAHRLYVSMIGFESGSQDIVLREGGTHTFDFKLKPAVVQAPEVTLEGKRNRKWQARLEKFTDLFIGETPNADETKILNPTVLDFEDRLGTFTARASEPLVIENHALGYRIQYFLKEFEAEAGRTKYDGEPLFEEMTPESPAQAAIWQGNRRKAYFGSFRHFILSVFDGSWKDQGFMLYHRPANQQGMGRGTFAGLPGMQQRGMQGGNRFPIEPSEFVKDGPSNLEKTLDFPGYVEIVYTRETEDPRYLTWGNRVVGAQPKFQTSMIQLEKGATEVDYKGDPIDPYGITFYGYFAFERVADELPKEYRP